MSPTARFTLLDAATVAVAVAIGAFALWVGIAGPEGPLPMHFDARGNPDRWGDRTELAGVLGVLAVLAVALGLPMGWYARRTPDPARARGLALGQLINILAIGGVTVLMAISILGPTDTATRSPAWAMAGAGVLLIVVGAGLGRVAPNPIIGVRTPWTYKSRLSWDRSNRLAGRLLFWIGVGAVLAAPIAPQPVGIGVLVAASIGACVWTVFESWRVWRTDPDRQPF